MPRYSLNQKEQKSCAGACIAVALKELGIAGFEADQSTEMRVYGQVQRGSGQESAPSKIDKFLNAQPGIRAWIMESPLRTGALIVGSKGALIKPWLEYSKELWSDWSWRYSRGLVEGDFRDGARVMLCSIIADGSNRTHFILARKDGNDYYVMNPDGGSDELHNDLFSKYINSYDAHDFGGVDYVYTGICIWIVPSSAPRSL